VLWLQNPILNLFVVVAHIATVILAAFWFGNRWKQPTLSVRDTRYFVASLIGLLPVIGSVFLFLMDNHRALRAYGVREGLGSLEKNKATPQDSLNYFSAPEQYTAGNVRNTKDLISSLDDEAYLGLLIASRHLLDDEAYALLTEALYSPFESARLMAYSLRGKLEDRIANALEDKLNSLKLATSNKQKVELNIELAKDYLHIINVGIESGDKGSLLKQANKHTLQALKLNNQSVSGFRTLSKVLRFQGDLIHARKAEQRALSLAAA
jgi:tetratricopeptide (TPR) repeat protein